MLDASNISVYESGTYNILTLLKNGLFYFLRCTHRRDLLRLMFHIQYILNYCLILGLNFTGSFLMITYSS